MAHDYDVIILGSGVAGLSAALAAVEARLSPLVLEKSELLGGGTTNSAGLVWVGDNDLQREAGYFDRRDDILSYMRFLGGGEIAEERMLTFIDRSPGVLRFFSGCGISFRIVRGVTDHYFGSAPGALAEGRMLEPELISGFELGPWQHRIYAPDDVPHYVTAEEQVSWGGLNSFSQWDKELVRGRKQADMRGKGLGLICHFVKALHTRKVTMRTGHQVARLSGDGQRVDGVVLDDGQVITAKRGVVIATGGYDWNVDLGKQLEGFPDVVPMGPVSLTGDGLVLGAELGAVVHRIQNCLSVMLGYTIPSATEGEPPASCRASIVELFSPHTLLVNHHAERFADESYFQEIVPRLRQFDALRHQYPNVPCYLIFDAQYLERYSFANQPVGTPVPGFVAHSDSTRELGAKLGIDSDKLAATVDRFNTFARTGVDGDFHRGEKRWRLASASGPAKNPSLGTIEKPPFYGVQLLPSIGNSTGLLANQHGQVMHHRGRPIEGLYVSGVAAARTEMGAGYQAGMNLASAMTFSYLAVEHMAGKTTTSHSP
jgi:3-oxosteroid 1-dehydrogenase